ncbi:MAG: WD40 repeat domain-containing protein, partial [Chloroflexota bacterium]
MPDWSPVRRRGIRRADHPCEPRNRLRLIITLRADFYDRPLSYFEFGELVREHTEVVLPLSAQELENAIVRPAQRVGVTLEPGLTSAIVADVREQPGALPLLQYALTQLFERRDGGRLTLQAYADIGGAMGALAKRAEEIYQSLDLEERDAGQQMFLRLVTLGEGQEDTRRRINQSELNSLGHPEAMAQVIGVFGEQRLLTFDNDPHTREPTLEVAHEALIREWHRLRDWLDTAREDLRTQRRLNQATMEWLHSGQDRSFLATGSRLDQFEALKTANRVAMNEEEGIYLDRSISQREEARLREEQRIAREEELEEKSRRQLQMTLTVVSVAAVIALALAILSGFLFRQSQSNLTLARDNEAEALSARSTAVFNADLASVNAAEAEARASEAQAVALAANALNVLDNFRPTLSLGLALESVALEPDLQPVQQALAQTAYAPGAIAQINPQPDVSMLGISFSSDGTEMAAALFNGQVLVINADDHTVRLEIPAAEGEETPILAVDYSPTAPVIASGGVDGVVRLWDAENGKIVHRMEGHTAQVRELAFSPDGRLLVSGGDDTLLNLWDVETGTLIRTIGGETGHPGRIVTVDFSGDGQRVVSGATDTRDENNSIIDDDRTARVWDVESGDLLATLHIPESGWPRAADLSPDGSVALVATYDPNEFGGIVRMWDVESESVVRMFTGHSDVITTLDIAPDGQTFISGSWDRSVRRWEIATGAQIQRFNNHDDRILDVDFSPDGEFIATTSGREPGDGTPFDNSAFFFSLQRRDLIRARRGHVDGLWSV